MTPQLGPNFAPKAFWQNIKNEIASSLATQFLHELNAEIDEQDPSGLETALNGSTKGFINQLNRTTLAKAFNAMGSAATLPGVPPCAIRSAAFKSSGQETNTGSDIAIFFEVFGPKPSLPPIISKTLLIQAKVGHFLKNGDLSVSNDDLRDQVKTILSISPGDGFVLVYTSKGAYCIDASEAEQQLALGNTVRSGKPQTADMIVRKLVNCQAGNAAGISPLSLNVNRRSDGQLNLSDAASKLATYGQTTRVKSATSVAIKVQPPSVAK
jgi:hypothetical protein